MTIDSLKEYKEKLNKLTEKEEKLRNIYLSKLANGEIQGPLTEYPNLNKPWLKNYSEDEINMEIPKKTMYELLIDSSKSNLKKTALVYFNNKITFEQVIKKIDDCAKALKNMGVKENEIVTICMPSTPETIYLIYALNKIGAVANLIDPRMNVESLKYFLNEVKSTKLFTIDLCNSKFDEIKDECNLENIVSISVADSMPPLTKIVYNAKMFNKIKKYDYITNWNDFSKNIENQNDTTFNFEDNKDAIIVHTSGTSGIPKGVVLTNENVNGLVTQYKTKNLNISSGQKFLDIIPPFASYGICGSLHMPLVLGLEIILIPKFEASKFSDLIEKYKPNHVLGVPSFWENMAKTDKKMDLSFLISPGSGGDIITDETEKFINEYLEKNGSNSKLIKGYGMTELSSSVCTCMHNCNELTSVGIPLVKNTIEIIDTNTGKEVPYNQLGEICISGPTMMKYYYDNEKLTDKTIKVHDDGKKYIHTGDIGYMTENGVLYVKDRIKRMIVRFDGFKIYPSSIENVIMQSNYVDSCAVIAYEEENLGIMPVAYISLKDKYKENAYDCLNEIIELCKEKLAERAVPNKFEIIDNIPISENGKINITKLEEYSKEKIYKKGNN